MKQIALDIGLSTSPGFANFYAAGNEEVLQHLQTWVQSATLPEGKNPVPTYLWGPYGSGKSHLLQAARDVLHTQNAKVGWLDAAHEQGGGALPEFQEFWEAVFLDDVHLYNPQQQHTAFNWFVNAQTHKCLVLAAGLLPAVELNLRDDLRTRLASGYTFAVHALDESQCRAALQQAANERGVSLSGDVVDYMLTRFSRDMGSLMELLIQLDAYALQTQRNITVPLIRAMMENP